MKINLKHEPSSEKADEQAESYACLVTGTMSSLQPESMSVVMHDWHDWHTYAGLSSVSG